ncbi:hypothetical protein B5E58_11340 [Tyzzerella sp. An114]|uniref:DUF3991 and toprim domain-containing protein n=1 Tax=Tyzzerella sp. An114 TaxID=1965545 RepID=UPI000B4320A6|nr:DUF3991 and toprim domain-containing protein [Tyzzerella sp. An114]OUQ56124.1 hypothetical protein B5E58_11340 [Tyzzerella sp. An114]
MALYTNEQIQRANDSSLETYLRKRGEQLKPSGTEFILIYTDSTGTHDSITIRNNKWYDHKNGIGGYPIQFMKEFYGLNFRDALKELLYGEEPMLNGWTDSSELVSNYKKQDESVYQKQKISLNAEMNSEEKRKAEFILPVKANNNDRMFEYLTEKRYIPKEVVEKFVDKGLIYQESKYRNIVFLGTDENGVSKSASKKSTSNNGKNFKIKVASSDTSFGFCWRGKSERVFVFEAAVDLMSFITLSKEDWENNNYIALDGLSPKPLLRFIEENKNIKEVYLCLDYDIAGIEAGEKINDILDEMYGDKITTVIINPLYKDWNEELKAKNGKEATSIQIHPKKESCKKTIKNLISLNRNDENKYITWRDENYKQKGINFYIDQIKRDFDLIEKSVEILDDENIKILRGAFLRIADISASIICKSMKDNYTISTYIDVMLQIENEYKPYKDKCLMKNRIEQMKEEIGYLENSFIDNSQSFLLWAKNLLNTSIKAEIYAETDYIKELERMKMTEEPQMTMNI